VEDKIEVLVCGPPIRREVAIFITLAAGHAQANLCHRCSRQWQRSRAPRAAALAADGEVMQILAPRLNPADLDMHGMAELRRGSCCTILHDLAHALAVANAQSTSTTFCGMPSLRSSGRGASFV
jgi:hypothetical protein